MKRMLSTLRKLLGLLPRGSRRFLYAYSTALGALSILDALSLGLLALIISPLVSDSAVVLPVLGSVSGLGLIALLAAVCALLVVKGVLSLALTWAATRRFARYEVEIGSQLFDAYLASPWTTRLQRNSSDLVRIADVGIAHTISRVLLPAASLPGEFLTFVVVLTVLGVAQPLIALVSLLYLTLVGVVMFLFISRRAHVAGRVGMRSSLRVARLITEMVGALKEIVLRDKTAAVAGVVKRSRVEAARARANIFFLANVPRYVLEAALVGGFVLVGVVGFLVGGVTQAVTGIALFALAGFRMAPSIHRFQQISTDVIGNLPLAEAVIADIEAIPTTTGEPAERRDEQQAAESGALVFDRVSFRYPDSADLAVAGLDLRIEFGESIAIVGASGSGKSTLIDLLLGLIEPTEGAISIDDVPLGAILRSWRSRVGYVPQEVSLFDGTFAQNVALSWSDDFDRERVERALEQAQLLEVVRERFGGIDGEIGERGLTLSGGQRQRLGIARALYSEPLVLVLDEATSALDTVTEAAVSDAVKALRGRITTVVVAHRLSTIKDSNKIVFLSGGRLVAQGDFATVVARAPEFAVQAGLAGLVDDQPAG
jgi:ABC-type multidrug transport system fused ATPase/permease subunit